MFKNPEKLAAQVDENRKFFISNCIGFDQPRLDSEEYPDGLDVESDIPYIDGEKDLTPGHGPDLSSSERILDLYKPSGAKTDEIFLLIHGGAFVYGCKELDKCFGMHLAKKSGMTVANINYRLFPTTNMQGALNDIFAAISFLVKKGYTKIHTIGDSAGGYYCHITAILLNSERARKECGITTYSGGAACISTSPICGDHLETRDRFAGYYFDPEKKMPDYIFDLVKMVKEFGCPPVVLTTGDQDMMMKQNIRLHKKLMSLGIPVEFYCAQTTEKDRPMHHVYAIAHPTWPEAIKTIDMTIANANRRNNG